MSAAQFVGRTLWRDSRTESLAGGSKAGVGNGREAGSCLRRLGPAYFGIQALYLTNAHPSRKNGRAK